MFSKEDYEKMVKAANAENKVLYVIGTGLPDKNGNFHGELALADAGYYICLKGTTITDGMVNPEYGERKKQETIRTLRLKRERVCFPVINRGKTWYDKLTDEQYSQLKEWYEAWLCATQTLVEPATPEWIK